MHGHADRNGAGITPARVRRSRVVLRELQRHADDLPELRRALRRQRHAWTALAATRPDHGRCDAGP